MVFIIVLPFTVHLFLKKIRKGNEKVLLLIYIAGLIFAGRFYVYSKLNVAELNVWDKFLISILTSFQSFI